MVSNLQNYYAGISNSDVKKNISDIDKKITEEMENETPDNDRIVRLRYEKMLQGMKLNNYLYNRYNNNNLF